MKYGTLKKLCLAYLEQDIDTNVMEEEINDLKQDDVFKEYLNNIDGSIYNAISRLVQAKKLPIKSVVINKNDMLSGVYNLPLDCYQVKEINKITNTGFNGNIMYQIIGKQLVIPNIKDEESYIIVYFPRFLYFDTYLDIDNLETIDDLDLEAHGLPDELAITIKYAVYGDMKTEENPSLAANNRNYFEAILAERTKIDVFTHQAQVNGDDIGWQLD